jgi:hypothetical protein
LLFAISINLLTFKIKKLAQTWGESSHAVPPNFSISLGKKEIPSFGHRITLVQALFPNSADARSEKTSRAMFQSFRYTGFHLTRLSIDSIRSVLFPFTGDGYSKLNSIIASFSTEIQLET